jgi:hypothetical protein
MAASAVRHDEWDRPVDAYDPCGPGVEELEPVTDHSDDVGTMQLTEPQAGSDVGTPTDVFSILSGRDCVDSWSSFVVPRK